MKIIISNLKESPNYRLEVLKLIETEFKYSGNYKYEIDFAQLMNIENSENCLVGIDNYTKKLVAHLGYTRRKLQKENHFLNICLIGGIVTDKQFRGKGIFKKLMNACIDKNISNTALFLLWSDLKDVYEKFHFNLTGGTIETGTEIMTTDNCPNHYIKTNFTEISSKDFDEIKKIYQQESNKLFFTLKREEHEWQIIRKMSSIDLYIKKDKNNKICTYFCYNKGFDLKDIIHEIGSYDINSAIKELSKYKLWLPESFFNYVPKTKLQFTSFIKTGNTKLLKDFLEKASSGRLIVYKMDENETVFYFNNIKYTIKTSDFLQSIFGPNQMEEFKHLNLSIYVSGSDSI